ncbi:MAG: 5-formyltetrahydrofolate cyclo-ligase [Rickettsiaceae bacterium]|nr:5-formyltetrahydrofolate cyclo-ligase [Rickettsiaceae bacterium]
MGIKHSLRKKILAERALFNRDKLWAENKLIVENTKLVINSLYGNLSNKHRKPIEKETDNHSMVKVTNSVGLYLPLKGEPDLTSLLDNNWVFCLPKINGDKIEFVHYHKSMVLEKGSKGIKHPSSDTILVPSIVIVPGLAYCQKGYRLGFGSGCYDKYFSRHIINTLTIKIGVCFDKYLLESLPIEKHDIKFNYVITENTILKL